MDYSWPEIEELQRILLAEVAGEPVDRHHAGRVAERLAELCPDIRFSMQRVRARMAT